MPKVIRGGIVLVLILACAGAARAGPPVWTVKQGQATVVLFGSIHLLPPGLDWEPAELTAALARADALYFELPLDAAMDAEAMRLRARRGFLAPGDSLSAHLSPTADARLRRVAADLGVSLVALERMQPWLAEVTLSVLDDLRAGAQVSAGVEQRVQNLCPPNVPRRAFETARFQIGLLAGASRAEQLASLEETLEEIADRPQTYRQVVAEWMAGDLAGLQSDALRPLEAVSPALYRRLITNRNRRWSRLIAALLKRPGTTVVIVGMGHLLGSEGVPALLRARGIPVSGP
jgi:uncharacterized protein YbaP (TraB family)